MRTPELDLSDYEPTADLARAATIPARWYVDPALLALERRKVFGATWQPIARAADLREPGSFFAADVVGDPVVLVRGKDGVLRAFANVCRHRAAAICQGAGKAASLRCPYHGWTYGLDGKLIGTPEFEGVENFDRHTVELPQFRVAEWGPYVFVNQDAQAPSLEEVLGPIPQECARVGCDMSRLRLAQRRDYVIQCNWKVYVDNYLEGYHLPAAHPGLFRELDYAQYRVDTFRYYSSQYAPIRARKDGNEARRYNFTDESQNALYYWIFPNFMLNVYPDNMSANIIVPLGHDKTLTIFEWFTYAEADGKAGALDPATVEFSDEIQVEDIGICEAVQKGLQSSTYTQGRFSVKRENGVHHFQLLLHEFLSRA